MNIDQPDMFIVDVNPDVFSEEVRIKPDDDVETINYKLSSSEYEFLNDDERWRLLKTAGVNVNESEYRILYGVLMAR